VENRKRKQSKIRRTSLVGMQRYIQTFRWYLNNLEIHSLADVANPRNSNVWNHGLKAATLLDLQGGDSRGMASVHNHSKTQCYKIKR